MNTEHRRPSLVTSAWLAVSALASVLALSACAPAIVAVGVGAGAMVATDRRSAGTQIDDQAIELKVPNIVNTRWPNDVHLNVTSFNGMVLLTGEAPTAEVRDEIAKVAKGVDRVRLVQNEMVVGPVTTMSARTNDTYITSKVKARFVESSKLSNTHVKVVTERGVVYLMGLVSRGEGNDAAQLAAATTDVVRVIKLFEYLP